MSDVAHPVYPMLPETAPAAEPEARPVGFREVPWLWRDLIIGLVPVVAVRAADSFARVDMFPFNSLVFWLAITVLAMAWMFGYPLWVARRRNARLPLLSIKTVMVEGLLSLPIFLSLFFGMMIVLVIWFWLAPSGWQPHSPLEAPMQSGNWLFALVFTLFAATTAPITEEVFFRGMIYNGLRQRIHPLLAALLQAVIFGSLHTFGAVHAVAAALLGLVLAGIYEWRRTLLAPMFVHFLQNATAGTIAILFALSVANAPVIGISGEPCDEGCLITYLAPESGAAEAGLCKGDIITSIDGKRVTDIGSLAEVVRQKRIGDYVWVEFVRDNESYGVRVVLKRRP